MGNFCVSSRREEKESLFSEKERDDLEELYNSLTADVNGKETNFNGNAIQNLFPENPELGNLVYLFIKGYSGNKPITYEIFETAMEILIKDHEGYRSTELARFEKVDILAILYLKNIFLLQDDLKTMRIEYMEAYNFLETILKIFHYNAPGPQQVERIAVRAVLDSVFNQYQLVQVDWWSFLNYIKKNLLFANRCIQSYFAAKFLKKPIRLKAPLLSQRSFLLSKDLLSLVFLSNMYIHNVNQLERLCSFKYTSSTFEDLVQALKEYDAPTILLFKVSTAAKNQNVPDQEEQGGVLGAFNFSLWKSDGFYHGNSGCYLFSLTPKFRVFLPSDSNSKNSKNFTYLNASANYNPNIGIGFGGTIQHGFRLWIDGRDPSKSYARAEDDAYRKGPFVDTIDGSIRVDYVEVWGLGTELAFLTDSNYLENDELITRKSWITLGKARNSQLPASPDVKPKRESHHQFGSLAKSTVSKYSQEYDEQDKIPQSHENSTYLDEGIRYSATQTIYPSQTLQKSSPEQRRLENLQEKEKKAVYNGVNSTTGRHTYANDPIQGRYSQQNPENFRKSYATQEGYYYNPFKQTNEQIPIVRKSFPEKI